MKAHDYDRERAFVKGGKVWVPAACGAPIAKLEAWLGKRDIRPTCLRCIDRRSRVGKPSRPFGRTA